MRVLKFVGIGLLALVVIVLLLGLVMPKEYAVERSVVINAPHSVVEKQVSNFSQFHEWSPWSEMEPDMKWEVKGTDGEVGAVYSWKGEEVGSGSQEILEKSAARVDMKLNFTEPWESENKVAFLMDDVEEGVKVTWQMEGNMAFPMNVMGIFGGMDGMIGKDFEAGLAKLKTRCESMKAETPATSYNVEEVEFPEHTYAVIKKNGIGFNELEGFFSQSYGTIMTELGKQKVEPAGPPSGIYFKWDETSGKADMAAAMPVPAGKTFTGLDQMTIKGKALKVAYQGPYEGMMGAHVAIDKAITEKGLDPAGATVVEEYVTDPGTEPDQSKWLTNIYYVWNK